MLFLCGDFIRSSFLLWRSYFLTWRLYSDPDGSVTVFERGNGRFHRFLGHNGGSVVEKTLLLSLSESKDPVEEESEEEREASERAASSSW